MASALSYEYLQAIKGQANGLATLDSAGTIPTSLLPASVIDTYKGIFADEAALIAAYPTGNYADHAYVTATTSYWFWNSALTTPAWVNQEITEAAYTALSDAEKASVPYLITA